MDDQELVEMLKRTVGKPEDIASTLKDRPGTVVNNIGTRAIVDPRTGRVTDIIDDKAEQKAERERWLQGMAEAVAALREDGANVRLSKEQRLAVRAIIVLVGRPALLIRGRRFYDLPPETWSNELNTYRELIWPTFASVGKIELGGPSADRAYAGTGFLVAINVIMTNRHVARIFYDERTWTPKQGVSANIDFVEEYDADSSKEFPITGIVGVHERLDLALFTIGPAQGRRLPKPLEIESHANNIAPGDHVYTVGYPGKDDRADSRNMNRLFGGKFGFKRMAPGQVMSMLAPDPVFLHDCSTLGGNSGSCVINLRTQRVVGLHYWGLQGEANTAVALWKLVDDPLLKEARVNFV